MLASLCGVVSPGVTVANCDEAHAFIDVHGPVAHGPPQESAGP
jgi:hypothetical protein